jgi:hypothetical protein
VAGDAARVAVWVERRRIGRRAEVRREREFGDMRGGFMRVG